VQIKAKGNFGKQLPRPYLHMLYLSAALNREEKITIGNRYLRVRQRHDADPHLHSFVNSIDLNGLHVKADTSLARWCAQLSFVRPPRRQIKSREDGTIDNGASDQQRR
jgi:hypothetical protein